MMHNKKWALFKTELPHKQGEYAKRNWGSGLHSLCSYQGKMKPSLAYWLVDIFSEKGDVVFDPFSGSGTLPLEAAKNGRVGVGSDLSDIAVAITNGKVGVTSWNECLGWIEQLADALESKKISAKTLIDTDQVAFNKSIPEYFEKETLSAVQKARDFFLETKNLMDPNWCLVFSSMLHILHGNRPYALSRRSHPMTPYAPTGPFEKKDVLEKLRQKVEKSINQKTDIDISPQSRGFQADILNLEKRDLGDIDVIITSPPFSFSTKFYMTNWMRFWFSGWGIEDFENRKQQYIESKQIKSMNVYKDIMSRFSFLLKNDGVIVLHTGSNKKMDMAERISELRYPGFELIDKFSESVMEIEKHGLRDKGGTSDHQFLVYQKRT